MQHEIFLVAGLGITGAAVAELLAAKKYQFAVTDESNTPALLPKVQNYVTAANIYLGKLVVPPKTSIIILSPGISVQHEVIQKAIVKGVQVWSEIELFAHFNQVPVIAITGANGKSTVAALITHILTQAQYKVALGGNFGTPAISLLNQKLDYIILELSSFQLETTYTLRIFIAIYLNLTLDHMDRYHSLMDYNLAKQRIYQDAQHIIYNANDKNTYPIRNLLAKQHIFSLAKTTNKDLEVNIVSQAYLNNAGDFIIDSTYQVHHYGNVNAVQLLGLHNYLNILASIIVGNILNLNSFALQQSLKTFVSLAHRSQLVAIKNDITYVNDSKATNPGAVIAALQGLKDNITGKWILLLGGLSKNADFSCLLPDVLACCKAVIVFGSAKDELFQVFHQRIMVVKVTTLSEALQQSILITSSGDGVLLAPACASFDQFNNYQDRGEKFCQLVHAMN